MLVPTMLAYWAMFFLVIKPPPRITDTESGSSTSTCNGKRTLTCQNQLILMKTLKNRKQHLYLRKVKGSEL